MRGSKVYVVLDTDGSVFGVFENKDAALNSWIPYFIRTAMAPYRTAERTREHVITFFNVEEMVIE